MRHFFGFGALLRRRGFFLGLSVAIAAFTALTSLGLMSFAGAFIAAAALAGVAGSAGSLAFIVAQPAWIGFFAVTRILGRYVDRLVSHEVTLRLIADLRHKLFKDFIPLAPSRLASWHSGDLLARITADIDALEGFTVRVLLPFAGAGAVVLAALILFFWIDARIGAALAVGCAIAGGWLPWRQGRRAESAGRNLPKAEAELRSILVDGIEGLPDLISAGAVDRYRQKAASHSLKVLKLQEELHGLARQAGLLADLWAKATFGAVLWLALDGVVGGRLNGVEAAFLCFGALATFETVAGLAPAWQHLARALASAKRIGEIARQAPSVSEPVVPLSAPQRYDLTLAGVSFAYDRRGQAAIQDLSLSLPQGHKLAVLGENGAGKTTLACLLLRLYDPRLGAIYFGGVDLRQLRQADLWQRIAYLPQRPDLFEGSLADNLRIAQPEADEAALWSALTAVGLAGMARQRQGLDTQTGQGGLLLSGGQARRLALARLLLTRACIWVLDEATESVDSQTEALLLDTILADSRRTVVFITHRHTALDRFDRVLSMREGQLHPAS